jgi:hypothetical protein
MRTFVIHVDITLGHFGDVADSIYCIIIKEPVLDIRQKTATSTADAWKQSSCTGLENRIDGLQYSDRDLCSPFQRL